MPYYYDKACPECGGRVQRSSSIPDDGLAHRHRRCGGGRRGPGPRPACRVCAEPVKQPQRTYCSNRCAGIARRSAPDKSCEVCKKSYSVAANQLDRSRWCSAECQAAGRIKSGEKWWRNLGVGGHPWCPVSFPHCRGCGELFAARNGKRYCSKLCLRDVRYRKHLEDATQRTNELYRLTRELAYPHESRAWRHALHRILEDKDGGLCAVCFEQIDLTLSGRHADGPTVEHITPRSRGGSDKLENLALSHWRCNKGRGTRDLAEVWGAA
jgi:5-methylcytosine-specific restriction endonuclease McrA